jgi:hypothetical protein
VIGDRHDARAELSEDALLLTAPEVATSVCSISVSLSVT